MSKEFNYKKAQLEWAYPLYLALPEKVIETYKKVIDEYKDIHQNRGLGMDFIGGFKELFESLSTKELADSAKVIYYMGHWDSADSTCNWLRSNHGAHWKYELLAKQEYAGREDRYEYPILECPSKLYMDHKEGTEYDNEEKTDIITYKLNNQDVFTVLKVDNVNHKPHIPVIGTKAMNYAHKYGMGIIGNDSPCDHPGCTLKIKDHTSDKVCFLKLKRNCTNTEAQTILKALTDDIGEKFIDGFAFVETTEKYRIE